MSKTTEKMLQVDEFTELVRMLRSRRDNVRLRDALDARPRRTMEVVVALQQIVDVTFTALEVRQLLQFQTGGGTVDRALLHRLDDAESAQNVLREYGGIMGAQVIEGPTGLGDFINWNGIAPVDTITV